MTTPNEPGQEGQGKAFEPMPAAPALNEEELAPVATAERPKAVRTALILWLVIVAFMLISVILVLAASDDSLRQVARDILDRQGKKTPTDQEVTDTIKAIRIGGAVYNLVFAVLILVFAFLMRTGKNWARITVSVVGGLYIILGVLNGVSLLFLLIELLIMAAAIFLMYRPETKPFFTAGRASR
jgi:hypothetical protein